MKTHFFVLFALVGLMCGTAHASDVLARDTSDPLFMMAERDVLSETHISYGRDIMRLGQGLSYAFADRFNMSIRAHYQIDFDGHEDGFSNIDIGGKYRLTRPGDTDSRIISDMLFGVKFGGSSHVHEAEYADTVYYAGLRLGRQWTGFTLAGTLKTSWIFDDVRGMAYIDAMPEMYFRLVHDWRVGVGFNLRKATKPAYDEEWLNGRVIKQFGRTQYIGDLGYEFENRELRGTLKVNILF